MEWWQRWQKQFGVYVPQVLKDKQGHSRGGPKRSLTTKHPPSHDWQYRKHMGLPCVPWREETWQQRWKRKTGVEPDANIRRNAPLHKVRQPDDS